MTRIHLGLLFMVMYICWVIYRLFVKRDLRQHRNEFSLYTFFTVVWALIYYWFFFKEVNHFLHAC